MATAIHRAPVADNIEQGASVAQTAEKLSALFGEPSAQPEPEPAPEATQEPLETPDVAPDTDEPPDAARMEADEAPEPESAQTAPEPERGESEGDADEIELEPAQLADLLGLDESDLMLDEQGALAFRTKVDGSTGAASLRDLRDSYQLTRTAQQRLSKLSEDRKAFEQERQVGLQSLGQQTERLTALIDGIEKEAAAEWQGVDWNKLREEDPSEYAARRADFDDRRRRIEGYQQQRNEHLQMLEAYKQHQMVIGYQKLEQAMAEDAVLKKAGPWDDVTKQSVWNYMISQGIPIEVLKTTPVWQAYVIARKAMLYDNAQTQAKETARRVVKLPKIKAAKPGAAKTKQQVKRNKMSEARTKQRKAGGNLQATADRISVILRGG